MLRSLFLLFLLSSPAVAQPNIVLLIGDDMDVRQLGFMGDATVRTPNLDYLAATGAVLRDVSCPQSLCRPSLASLFTGRTPHECNVKSHLFAPYYPALQPSQTLLYNLRQAGYRVRIDGGKWWESPTISHCDEAGYQEPVGNATESRYWRSSVTGSMDFLRRCKAGSDKFVLVSLPSTPHLPHTPPAEHLAKYPSVTIPAWFAGNATDYVAAQQKYLAMTSYYDEYVGTILGHLESLDLAATTLIVFVSDNGWITGRPGKSSPYDVGNRSCAIFAGAGVAPQSITQTAEMRDVLPTVLDLCGVAIPASVTGRSLKPVLQGGSLPDHDYVFGFSQGGDETQPFAFWARRGSLHYVRYLRLLTKTDTDIGRVYSWFGKPLYRSPGQEQFFDLATDPDEQNDLQRERQADVTAFRNAAAAWWQANGEPTPADVIPPHIYNESQKEWGGVSGMWTQGTRGYAGGNFYAVAGSGSVSQWTIAVEPGHAYQVAVTWPTDPNRATNTPFTVVNGSQQVTLRLNQELQPNDFADAGVPWESLGDYVSQSSTLAIQVSSDANEYVIADAVRVVELP